MNTEITRQYDSPKSLSISTTNLVKQFKPIPSPQGNNSSIPDAQDLLSMRQDLQALLPATENRLNDLQKSVNFIEKTVKICDPESSSSSGKNVNAILEKMKIKQETEDSSDILHNSSKIPKSDTSRQAALETLKRRKRREDTMSPDNIIRHSEPPHHTIKLKANSPITARSVSPSAKPKNDIKKVKKSASRDSSKHHKKREAEQVDFVRVKPKDQIPITTFWSTLEPYFRNLTEEDREFLLQKSDQGKAYLIPPLGQHYLEKWAEEDQAVSIETLSTANNEHKLRYMSNPHDMSDTQLLQNDLGGGALTERLISSLVMENILPEEEEKIKEQEEEDDIVTEEIEKKYNARTVLQSDPPPEIVNFEERLKRELRYVGLFNDEDIDWNAKEDDELCAELRSLAREFKEQAQVNDERKKRLLEVVDCQLQYEQYRQVLDTLDSQVEQGYLKRFRPQKSKKRKATGTKAVLSENTVYAMEKRKTWIDALGSIFKDKNMNMPETSIYESPSPDD